MIRIRFPYTNNEGDSVQGAALTVSFRSEKEIGTRVIGQLAPIFHELRDQFGDDTVLDVVLLVANERP